MKFDHCYSAAAFLSPWTTYRYFKFNVLFVERVSFALKYSFSSLNSLQPQLLCTHSLFLSEPEMDTCVYYLEHIDSELGHASEYY